jgi:hypothetical protein
MKYIAVRDQVLAVEVRGGPAPCAAAFVSAVVVQLTELIDRKRTDEIAGSGGGMT